MKRIVLFIAAMLACGNMMATEQLRLDSIVTSTEYGPSEKEEYQYTSSGESSYLRVYNYNNGSWTQRDEYRLEHVYSAGRLVSTKQNLNTGSGWVLMSRVDYAYDADGRLLTESRYSRSAAGSTWNEMSRNRYHYDASGQVDTLYHELWDTTDWDPYMTMVTNEAESTDLMRVMDRYWTGYEDEGADGRMVYYYSVQEITSLLDVEENRKPLKRIENGVLLIGDYSADGRRIR